jgi:hypothetical protein
MEKICHSDYIVYADESGDLSFEDKEYPVFVLAFCVFSKREYLTEVVRHIKGFKFDAWGHDMTVLHSKKIRAQSDDFRFLQGVAQRALFMKSLSQAIQDSPFTIISTAIDKRLLQEQYASPANPYELGLRFCLERLYRFLQEKNQGGKVTYVVLESRMENQNKELDRAFQEIVKTNKALQDRYPLKLIFGDKKANCVGLQIADLIAYPIGRYVLKPHEENLAFKIIEQKFHKFPNHLSKGLKVFPQNNEVAKIFDPRKAVELSETNP